MARHRRRLFLFFFAKSGSYTGSDETIVWRTTTELLGLFDFATHCWLSMTIGFLSAPFWETSPKKKQSEETNMCTIVCFPGAWSLDYVDPLVIGEFCSNRCYKPSPLMVGKRSAPVWGCYGFIWIESINKFAPFHWNDATTLDHLVYFLSNPISTAFSIHCSSKDFEYVRMDLGQYFQCLYYIICMC